MIQKYRFVFFVVVMVFVLAMAFSVQGADKIYTMRIAHAMTTENSFHMWALKFAEELKKEVGDQVDVKIFPNAQLGTETQYLENMKLGTIEGSVLGRHSEVDPRLDLLNLPLLFKSPAHSDKILRSGGSLEKLFNKMLLDKGYVCLGWGEIGFREISSNIPINSVNDLKGLVIRVPNSPVLLSSFKAWGANPTVLDFSEVYTALQTGVVKAEENPPELIYTGKFYEVQKYLTITNHLNIANEFLVSKKFWDTLPRNIQNAMLKAGQIGRDLQIQTVRKRNEDLVAELEKKGMTVNRNVDLKSFIPGAELVQKQFIEKYPDTANIIKSIIAAGK